MSVENPSGKAFDLIREHSRTINDDLARLNNTRRFSAEVTLFSGMLKQLGEETDMRRVLATLQLVTDPHFLLASPDGEYVTGTISATHADLEDRLNRKRFNTSKPSRVQFSRSFISGIGFGLKSEPSIKYVRLDVESRDWTQIPMFATKLIEGGYFVLDATYKRVEKEVNYGKYWYERNDV